MGWAKSESEPDCSFWMRMPRVEKTAGPRRRPFSKRKTATSSGLARGLQDDGAELAEGTHEFAGERADGFDLLDLRVESGGGLEFELGGGLVALGAETTRRLSPRVARKLSTAADSSRSARRCSPGSRGRGTSSSRSRRSRGGWGWGREIVCAAAQEEELEGLVGKALGGGAGGKGAVGPIGFALAGAVGDGDARIGVAAEDSG